jgi:hypothetical protein
MTSWKNYHSPTSVEEAIAVLQSYDGRARVIGGGTDLLVESRRGLRRPFEAIVDASGIAGLNTISYSLPALPKAAGSSAGRRSGTPARLPATLPTRCPRATAL